MTDNEREEFAYDIADHMLKSVSQAGIRAMAIDRICDLLLQKRDDELVEMAPACLTVVPEKKKSKRNKAKPSGF